jgi:hypothetical protein
VSAPSKVPYILYLEMTHRTTKTPLWTKTGSTGEGYMEPVVVFDGKDDSRITGKDYYRIWAGFCHQVTCLGVDRFAPVPSPN